MLYPRHACRTPRWAPATATRTTQAAATECGAWSMAQTTFPLLRGAFLQAAADILVLLRALTREIATLQSSPLILHSTYGGTYAGRISTVIGLAIRAGALNNLTLVSGGNI